MTKKSSNSGCLGVLFSLIFFTIIFLFKLIFLPITISFKLISAIISSSRKNEQYTEEELDSYGLTKEEKDMVKRGEYDPWEFDEEEMEEDDFHSDDLD